MAFMKHALSRWFAVIPNPQPCTAAVPISRGAEAELVFSRQSNRSFRVYVDGAMHVESVRGTFQTR